MKTHYIFDVDGTLTPSRQKMDEDFSRFFLHFCTMNSVYLVTGSDREKTLEQVGSLIYKTCKRVYNCSGSDVYVSSRNVYRDTWTLPILARQFLKQCVEEEDFNIRTGNHIEERPGMINYSLVAPGFVLLLVFCFSLFSIFRKIRRIVLVMGLRLL